MKQLNIACPAHLASFLKKSLIDFKGDVKFIEDPLDLRVRVEAFSWNLQEIKQKIDTLI